MPHKVFIDTKGKTPNQVAAEAVEKLSMEQQASTAAEAEGVKVIGPVITHETMVNDPEGCAMLIKEALDDYNKKH